MTEKAEKKGRLKVTIELEVNEELMDMMKDAMSKVSSHIPDMMRRGSAENKQ